LYKAAGQTRPRSLAVIIVTARDSPATFFHFISMNLCHNRRLPCPQMPSTGEDVTDGSAGAAGARQTRPYAKRRRILTPPSRTYGFLDPSRLRNAISPHRERRFPGFYNALFTWRRTSYIYISSFKQTFYANPAHDPATRWIAPLCPIRGHAARFAKAGNSSG
jgi:hypothetical protein